MRIVSSRILAVLFCLTMLPASAFAQASITGVVKDTSGAVLPGVTVEAASPALIEKVRTAVTDGSGQYRIVDLRAGTYAVTFTLTGFSTVKREGIELTGSFTATVNADLKVGHGDRDHYGHRRNADRRRPERAAAGDGQRRRHRGDSLVARLRRHLQPQSRGVDGRRRRARYSGHAGARGVWRAGRARHRGPCAARRTQHRRAAERRRHVGLRAGSRNRAGSLVHHVRRTWRSGSRRTGHEHRPEDRRQHHQGERLPRRRERRHGGQQLHAGAEGPRAAHAGRSPEALGFLGQRRRSDQEGPRRGTSSTRAKKAAIVPCRACMRTSTPASPASTPTSRT